MRTKKEIVDKINDSKKTKVEEAKIEKVDYIKKYGLIVGLILVLIIVSVGYVFINREESDAIKFKEEYEKLNGTSNSVGKEHMSVQIKDNNPIIYTNYEEVFNILDNGTAVIYFGFPSCPWCRALINPLFDASVEAGIDKIYYLNNMEDRDTKILGEDGKIVIKKDSTDEYKKLVEKLYDHLGVYEGLKDKTIKRLYFPTVLFVKDGKVVDIHIGTLDEQEDPRVPFTEDERQELVKILKEKMNKLIICDSSC